VHPAGRAGEDPSVLPQDELHFITRQPILDRLGRVHAYCLLTRTEAGTLPSNQRDRATRGLIDKTLLFGFEQITQGSSALIPCTPETLEDGLTEMLPPTLTVLLLQTGAAPVANELAANCKTLKLAGFRFCIAGHELLHAPAQLLELMDYVKVDFSSTSKIERQHLLEQAMLLAAAPIAEKVETEADYCQASREGFGLFHGYYFCRPEKLHKQPVPANRLAHLQILQLLQQSDFNVAEIARWVRNDTSLAYRLLRLVNSPACAIRQDVRSIETALMILGEKTFRRMALVAVSSELNAGNSVEVLRMAFLRSWFCEQVSASAGLDAAEQYLLGMLSLLPAMLGRPMEELIASLPLRDEARAALAGTHNRERTLLSWLIAYEAGDWDTATAIASAANLRMQPLVAAFLEAILHAEELLRLAV
jgi:EAL and modified HD-GYP domain-containing signal transduction protein